MGAVFFMTLLVIVLIVAIIFIVVNLGLVIAWRVRKKKGKAPKKWWFVLASIFLVINIVLAAIPIGYFGFLRVTNASYDSENDVTQTSTSLVWPMGEYEPTTQWFEIEGKKYIIFRKGFSSEDFYLDYGREQLGQPIANIKYPKGRWFNDMMWILLSGSTYSDQNVSTISPVINDNHFDFLYAELNVNTPTLRGDTYHEESTIEATKAYYNNLDNYNTGTVTCRYAVYRDMSSVDETHHVNPYEWIDRSLEIDETVFSKLKKLKETGDTVVIQMPEIPEDYSPAAQVGKPYRGYFDIRMKVRSLDGIAIKEVSFVVIDNRVYLSSTSSGGELTVYPLTDELNDYMMNHIIKSLEENTIESEN